MTNYETKKTCTASSDPTYNWVYDALGGLATATVLLVFVASRFFIAWLILGLIAWYMSGCVQVVENEQDQEWTNSGRKVSAFAIDSLGIYRCDTCAFARRYQAQSAAYTKPCKTCAWEKLPSPRQNNKPGVPLSTNPAVEAIAEKHGLAVERYGDQVRARTLADSASNVRATQVVNQSTHFP